MATKDEQDQLRVLVQHVGRAFYEPRFTIILDQLSNHPVLKDEELASRMGLQPKELNKIIAVLSNDHLVKIHRQNELREGAQRVVPRQYYYIDYEHFCNVVKWRIAMMHRQIDKKLRNELDNKGYICVQCKKTFEPLDVGAIWDFTQMRMVCDNCGADVIDNEDSESVLGSKDRMQRFNHQIRFIRDGLQKSEQMVLPAFDVAAWVQSQYQAASQQQGSVPGAGLKIAGSDGANRQDEGIGIVIAGDVDELTRRQERDAQAEAKRQQNALPAWHLKSTISGDLTALGKKEEERAQAMAHAAAPQLVSSNDDLLRGLGKAGSSALRMERGSAYDMPMEEDRKPVIDHEQEAVHSYYENLQRLQSAQASSQGTPLDPPAGSDFGDDDDDDDVEGESFTGYVVNGTNSERKRSRSKEDEGDTSRELKIARTDEPVVNGTSGSSQEDVPPDSQLEATAYDDEPTIYVNGKPMRYSEVTEDHHELMTPEEYSAYVEIAMSREEQI